MKVGNWRSAQHRNEQNVIYLKNAAASDDMSPILTIMIVIFALLALFFALTTVFWYKKSKIDPAQYQVSPMDTVRTAN